jgi:hypothetical protein
MKKTILGAAAVVMLLAASCGGSEVCDCVELNVSIMKEIKDAKMDPAKMKDIETKYKADFETCLALRKDKSGKDKSEEELKKMEEESKNCDSYSEYEKLTKEMMGGM